MNEKLFAAVEIFKTLGWENLTAENILQLPIGTPEQQKIALQGLQKGEWLELVKIEGKKYQWKTERIIDVELYPLALFAIRIGVSASRASQIGYLIKAEMISAQVIAERGAGFAAEFILRTSKNRIWMMAGVNVYLVHNMVLEIPKTVDYLKDWALFAEICLGLPVDENNAQRVFFPVEILRPRILEHIQLAVELGLPATGPFGRVFLTVVQQGILPRQQAIELAFFAMDAAVRPGDKKVWVQTLEMLSITDFELQDKAHVIIPLIATGETTILNYFGARLVTLLHDELLIELLIAAFSTSHKKSLQQILKIALQKNQPENAQNLAPWLSSLIERNDQSITNLVHTLRQRWQINIEQQEDVVQQKGLWRATPDVWQVPQFQTGEISKEALLKHLAHLFTRPNIVTDIYTEQFFAVLIALAYQSKEDTLAFLKGINGQQVMFMNLKYWFDSPKEHWYYELINDELSSPLDHRNAVLHAFIGKVPCLLSTPSQWDLSITASDLVARMRHYQQEKCPIWESDLCLALLRLNLSTVTHEKSEVLAGLNLPVQMPSGKVISEHAGKMVLSYIRQPIQEPTLDLTQPYRNLTFDLTNVSPDLPKRLQEDHTGRELYAQFPLFREASLVIDTLYTETEHDLGLIMRQIVRRAQPLASGGAINIFALQRSPSNYAAEDCFTAVLEAWERGLLRPNIADVKFLDWTDKEPARLGLLVNALARIAEEGLLSVVWPILDDLVVVSLNAVRLLSGTAEIVQLILTLLPEVELAIQTGLTDASALDLPGVRKLANKGGQSKAVRTAQNIVASIPKAVITEKSIAEKEEQRLKNTQVSEQEFAKMWYFPEKTLPYLDDGVEISIDWLKSDKKTKQFLFTLKIPNLPDSILQVSLGSWVFALHHEKQILAYKNPKSNTDTPLTSENEVWLYWDESTQTLVDSPYRDRYKQTDGPLSGPRTPLSSTLLVIILSLLVQNGMDNCYSLDMLSDGVEEGSITSETVLKSVEILLQHPVVNLSKLLRNLETEGNHLSTLWPILTQTIQVVGRRVATESPPVWINRLLAVAIRHAPYLKMAMEKGLIPAPYAKWPGLEDLAHAKGKSVAIAKAQELIGLLGL